MLIGFDELFSQKTQTKKPMKKPNREHGFFSFPKEARPQNHNRVSRENKIVTLAEEKKQKTRFFRFRGGTAVTLAKAHP